MTQKKNNMSLWYDEEGDYLEITLEKSPDTYFHEVKKGFFEIIDRKSKKIVGYAFFNFTKRKEKFIDLELPIPQTI